MGVGTVLGLALSLAGTGAGIAAASDAQGAMNDQVKNSLAQQEKFSQQSRPIFQDAVAQTGPVQAQKQISAGDVAALSNYRNAAAAPASTASPIQVDNGRVQGVVQQAQHTGAQGQGYSNQALQQWLANQQNNNQLGVISNLAHSDAANTGILTQLAGNSSAGLSSIGSLLSTAGGLAGVYGGLKGNPGSTFGKGAYNNPNYMVSPNNV